MPPRRYSQTTDVTRYWNAYLGIPAAVAQALLMNLGGEVDAGDDQLHRATFARYASPCHGDHS